MHQYLFTNRNSGTDSESLVSISLKDDHSAMRFGRRVVSEFMDNNSPQPAGLFMDITQDGRMVGNIALVALEKVALQGSGRISASDPSHATKLRMRRLRRVNVRNPIV